MVQALTRAGSRSISAVDAALVRSALSEVIDPETGISIVDLGLIYGIEIDRRTIRVRMTMATPGNPMSGMLADEVAMVIAHSLPWYRVHIDVVWHPTWQPSMMSPLGRQQRLCMHACPIGDTPPWHRALG